MLTGQEGDAQLKQMEIKTVRKVICPKNNNNKKQSLVLDQEISFDACANQFRQS